MNSLKNFAAVVTPLDPRIISPPASSISSVA